MPPLFNAILLVMPPAIKAVASAPLPVLSPTALVNEMAGGVA